VFFGTADGEEERCIAETTAMARQLDISFNASGATDPALKPDTIGGIHIDDDPFPTDSHVRARTGIPHRTLPSDLFH
jgi:hypothetical protein